MKLLSSYKQDYGRRRNMKQRILALLLSSALLFGGMAENIAAKVISAENNIAAEAWEETEEMPEESGREERLESQEPESEEPEESNEPEEIGTKELNRGSMPTGYRKPVRIDLGPEDITEIYDESETKALIKGSAKYRAVWDTYSTNYYYNMLNQNERNLWDKLDDMCYGYLTGTESLTKRISYYDRKTGRTIYYYTTKSVPCGSGLTEAQADNVIRLFYYSNPQYYFLEAFMGSSYGYANMSVNASFANGASRQAATKKIESEIKSWLTEINQESTDWAKEKKIHDMICEKVIYDPYYNTISVNPYNQTIYSVFCTNSTVCAGYSQAMQLLCNAVGIDCGVVTSEDHEWNIVRLNGAWYYVDCTWNDEDDGYTYQYFNRSSQYFMSNDSLYGPHDKPESIWDGRLPSLTYDSGATRDDPGTIPEAIGEMGAPVISCPGSVVTITAPAGGTVYYTTNGGEPSSAFTRAVRYTGPFPLYGNTTVKTMVVANGYLDSVVVSQTITPLYRITFRANGGYIGSSNITTLSKSGLLYCTLVGQLPNPKRSGYVFDGWYTAPYGGSKISASTKITADSDYYARWTKINPKKATISSAKNKSKRSIKIKIKNISTANGYQIRYSTKKSMKYSKKKTIPGNSYTLQKLTKGKTYYVQARMYQIDSVSGKKKYGAWSKAKSVKIQK